MGDKQRKCLKARRGLVLSLKGDDLNASLLIVILDETILVVKEVDRHIELGMNYTQISRLYSTRTNGDRTSPSRPNIALIP